MAYRKDLERSSAMMLKIKNPLKGKGPLFHGALMDVVTAGSYGGIKESLEYIEDNKPKPSSNTSFKPTPGTAFKSHNGDNSNPKNAKMSYTITRGNLKQNK